MKKKIKGIMKDSLYKNSIYPMVGYLVMAISGLIFWMINARLFSEEQVGLATTIISVMTLITTFSLLGLNSGLIRYLPKSERKNDKINTCFTLIGVVSIIVSAIFLLGISKFSPRLAFIKDNIILSSLFIIFMIFSGFNSLLESLFIAYRSTKYTLLKNTIFGLLRIIFPFILVTLGAYGIFSSWMIGVVIGVIVSFLILIKKFKFKFQLVFHDSIIRKIGKYSFANYVAGFIGGLPTLLLPIIITNSVHPEMTAYYYMAMIIGSLLFIIPQSVSNSLFAEGSYSEKDLEKHVKKSIKITALLLIPSIIITIFFGKYVLLLFGESYSSEGYMFLNLLAVSGIFVAINSIFGTLFRVKHKIVSLIIMGIISTISILSLSYLWINQGLTGIGFAWIIGQVINSIGYVVLWMLRKK